VQIKPGDSVLHLSFGDEAYAKANYFCGNFNRRQVGDKPFKQIDIDCVNLPFEDKQFDIVYCSHTLQLVEDPEAMLKEIMRIGRAAHIREYSEFAELLFGWPNHKWVIGIEDDKLVIKKKNPDRYSKFGPLFHRLYAEDPDCHRILTESEVITKISFDWYETDDEFTFVEVFDSWDDEDDDEIMMNRSRNTRETNIVPKVNSSSKKMKKVVTPVFKPMQTAYFDFDRIELGKVKKLLDII